jgi:serine/threonine protein phosphatase PrpC
MDAPATDHDRRITLAAWLVTDVGMVREHNEDSAHMDPQRGIFVVADGMGGHAAGEVASAMAVASVKESLEAAQDTIRAFVAAPTDPGRRGLVQLLQNAVLAAHQSVFQRGKAEADKAGMGTTLDVVLVAGPEAFVAHVGDSRTYLIRDGQASQVTTDHTVAEVLVIEGKLTIEEAQVSPLRTILVNAIGVSEDVGVEMAHVHLRRGDRMMLCSDGLHDYFPSEDEVSEQLGAGQDQGQGQGQGDPGAEAPDAGDDEPDAGEMLAIMVQLAKDRGGHDNITGVALEVLDVVEAAPSERSIAAVGARASGIYDVTSANQFADEPTQTSAVADEGSPPPEFNPPRPPAHGAHGAHGASGVGRQTQPLRSITPAIGTPLGGFEGGSGAARKLAHADTIPPEDPEPTQEMTPTPRVELAKAGRDPDDSTAPIDKIDDDDASDLPGARAKTEPAAT